MGQGVSAIRRHSNDHFYAAVQQGITLTTFLDIEIMKPFLNIRKNKQALSSIKF